MLHLFRSLCDLIRDNPYQYLLALAWRYAKGWRHRYLAIYGLFVVANVIVSLQPVIFGQFIDYLQSSDSNIISGAWIYAAVYLGTVLGFWAFHWPARLLERRLAFDISRRLLLATYDRAVHLPLDWHREHHSGDTINRTRKAYEALRNFFDNGFAYFQTLARMVIALAALIYFSPLFGLIAAITGLILLITILAFDRPFIEAGLETNERENSLLAGLTDNLGNIVTVATLRLGKRTSEQISHRADRIWPPFLRQTRINERKWFSVAVIVGLMYGTITVGYVYQHYTPGEIFLVGGLVTLLGFVQQFTNMLNNLTAQYTQVVRFRTDLAAIDPILAAHKRMGIPMSSKKLPGNWSEVSIRELSFRYPQTEDGDAGLEDVNLTLPRGGRIALIGSSGSGKSTILALLRGLYPADRMEVDFDGVPTDHPAALFEQTTLIPQNPEIFEDTVTANLTMGIPYAEREIEQALNITVFDEVLAQLPEGRDTFLAEGGANLSGGQRQRLSIARGLLAAGGSRLLLLDEPTSSLDPRTEQLLYHRLFSTFPEKTIVSTLHRLHLLRHFDYVYLMENGKLVGEGSPAELRKKSTAFQRLWAEQ